MSCADYFGWQSTIFTPNPLDLMSTLKATALKANLPPKRTFTASCLLVPKPSFPTSPGKVARVANTHNEEAAAAAASGAPSPAPPTPPPRPHAAPAHSGHRRHRPPSPTPPPFPHPRRASRVTPSYFPLVGKLLGSSGHAENRLGE